MKSQISDQLTDSANYGVSPFLWGNIALLTSLPWLLAMTMAGLAVGDPVFAPWFEIALLSLPAIAGVAWLQWQQPFYPFSLWLVTQSANTLSDRDRQALALLKQRRNGWYTTGWIAIAVAIVMLLIFRNLYVAAPLAEAIAPFPMGLRFFGIIWAEVFFFVSNAIAQAGISALRIKLTASSDLVSLPPIAIDKIKKSFTNFGKSIDNPISQAELNSPVKLSLVLEPKSEDLTELEPEIVEIPEEIIEPEAIAEVTTDLEQELVEIPEEIVELEAIAEVTTDLEQELVEIPEEIVEPEAIADDLGELTELEPEEIPEEIVEPKAIAEVTTELEPEIVEVPEEIVEPNAIAEVTTELEPEIVEVPEEIVEPEAIAEVITEITTETTVSIEIASDFEADFDIDAEIAKMIAEEEAAKLANSNDWQPETNPETENISNIEEFDDELDELIAFNIYTEKVLENYLTDEPTQDDTTQDDTCESSSNISEEPTTQEETKVKPAQILIEEFLVDKYLAKLEELGKVDRSNAEDNG